MNDSKYLELALGLTSTPDRTHPKQTKHTESPIFAAAAAAAAAASSSSSSSSTAAAHSNGADLGKLAFGSEGKPSNDKKKKSSRRKKHQIRPDDNPTGGSPMAKQSGKTRMKSKAAMPTDVPLNSSARKAWVCCANCFGWIRNPCRRISNYVNNKLKIFQYAKAFCGLMIDFLTAESTFRSGLLFVIIGLVLSVVSEMIPLSPKYNTIVLLAIMAAARFPNFPVGTMRPQICLVVLTSLAVALDIYYLLLLPDSPASTLLRVFLILILFAKVFALAEFLSHGQGTGKARKYLNRRVRLFGIPMRLPRRIMREVRSRILAIGIVAAISLLVFFIVFALSITTFGYVVFGQSPSSITLSTALFAKSISTFLFLLGILFDTDVILCLGHFGCLGFAMNFLKRYTQKRKDELGGWPYAYSFNAMRFQFLTIGKCADVGVGILVWVAMSNVPWRGMSGQLRVLIGFILMAMLATDIWTPVLFASVYWLLGKKQELVEEEIFENSDDSELDELAVREPRTSGSSMHKGSDWRLQGSTVSSKRANRWAELYLQDKNRRVKKYMDHEESDEDSNSDSGSEYNEDDEEEMEDDEYEDEEEGIEDRASKYGLSGNPSRLFNENTLQNQADSSAADIEANWVPRVTLPTSVTTSVHQFSSREILGTTSPTNHSGSDADRDSSGGGIRRYATPNKAAIRQDLPTVLEDHAVATDDNDLASPMDIKWEDGSADEMDRGDPPEYRFNHGEGLRARSKASVLDDNGSDSKGVNAFGIANIAIPKYSGGDGLDGNDSFRLDSTVEVEPIAFTHMWDTLAVGAKFSCRLCQMPPRASVDRSKSKPFNTFQLEPFRQHLQQCGFVVVAAGTHTDGFTKVYIVGATRTPSTLDSDNAEGYLKYSSTYFLSEFKIYRSNDTFDNGGNSRDVVFVMECVTKCTNEQYLPKFLGELKFGNIYRLL